MYKAVFSRMPIVDYMSGSIHKSGDLVWYLDNETKDLYLLRCIIPDNDNDPSLAKTASGALDDNQLKSIGWVNENPKLDILSSSVMQTVN